MIDCGANVGSITEQLALTGAKVIAFEPEPFAFSLLQQRVSHLGNVTLINAAVSDHDGHALLFKSAKFEEDPVKRSLSSSLISEKTNVTTENAVQVPVINFLDYCRKLNSPIKLLKMDIEGAEVRILELLMKDDELLARIGSIFVETHERKIPSSAQRVKAIRRFFKSRKTPYVNLNWC